MSNLPSFHGPALFYACLKRYPADFVVHERLDLPVEQEGEHWLLQIEKRGLTTDKVIRLLSDCLAVAPVDIGYCGMKDRQAVTRQWFSVRSNCAIDHVEDAIARFNGEAAGDQTAGHIDDGVRASLPDVGDVAGQQWPMLTLLHGRRHSRKLRHGAHDGNRFTITLRDVSPVPGLSVEALKAQVQQRIEAIARQGFPNYLGPQRFGRDGRNLQRALQWFRQPKRRTSRQQRSLWLSAARSELFNRVCAARIEQQCWHRLLDGEPAVLDGSRSFFATEGEASNDLDQRLAAFDIHPSAPWWGRGESPARGECAVFESEILSSMSDIRLGLERAGLAQERRALRAIASGLEHRWIDDHTWQLCVDLSPGVFATTLLSEFGYCSEPDRGG